MSDHSPVEVELEGLRALVTGATTGIGRVTAELMAERGAEVIVHGRNTARGEETVKAIADAGGKANFIAAELADVDAVRGLAKESGPVDILVNNAGVVIFGPTKEIDIDEYNTAFDINTRAAFILVGELAPQMVERGGGSIINVSTMIASLGFSGAASQAATKAGLEAMTRAWTAEYGAGNVRTNVVSPGPVLTPESERRSEIIEFHASNTALGRVGVPIEVAEVIAFLASPRAAYIAGVVLPIDGGRMAL